MAANHTGSSPAGALTITIGLGPGAFAGNGLPRPAALKPLPPFPGDALDPAYCAGAPDLLLSAEGAVRSPQDWGAGGAVRPPQAWGAEGAVRSPQDWGAEGAVLSPQD